MKSKVTVLLLVLFGIATFAWAQGDPAKGKALVQAKKCDVCHKEGSKTGKPMEKLAGGGDARIKAAITDPKKTCGPEVKMPPYKLSDAELQDIVAYLKSIAK